ncbi:pimeloyl-ACP methyl ester carboxylesterase [Antricoccus suffuscus]|uniref:Pimeloyl-ACP methyl ester carboxylesterase n=1 Tax=Antricoccus suffuscus TaxID=1629062 RepID=A0A2T1A1I0_9ACTN|nr:alpha/beta hydrolase [Antricoccus suffuscus]PRZ42188.1 pimeloyl-ACP methyl ester carboxylesterase [Antricoccus suffuscus]
MSNEVQRVMVSESIEIAYESIGDEADPPLLLVMGLGAQMIAWPDQFCVQLAARGYRVIRFDNRDVGLSTHLVGGTAPNVAKAMGGDYSSAAYTLSDMAGDAVGLLNALDIRTAHVVGASMGGMIVQCMAIEYPNRLRSMTSIMSTTGDRSVGRPSQAAMTVLLAPPATDREGAIARAVESAKVIGSPGFDRDDDVIKERAALAFDRAFDPVGGARQLVAIQASGDRTEKLRSVKIPTLVVHGAADALVDVSGGKATAEAIQGSKLLLIDGMSHDLPQGAWPQIVDAIDDLATRADA